MQPLTDSSVSLNCCSVDFSLLSFQKASLFRVIFFTTPCSLLHFLPLSYCTLYNCYLFQRDSDCLRQFLPQHLVGPLKSNSTDAISLAIINNTQQLCCSEGKLRFDYLPEIQKEEKMHACNPVFHFSYWFQPHCLMLFLLQSYCSCTTLLHIYCYF